jgi:hypothetical protein
VALVNRVLYGICYGFRGYDRHLCTRCLSRVLPHLATSKVAASIDPRHCRANDQQRGYIRNFGLVGRSLNTFNGRVTAKYVDGQSRQYVTTSCVIAPALSPVPSVERSRIVIAHAPLPLPGRALISASGKDYSSTTIIQEMIPESLTYNPRVGSQSKAYGVHHQETLAFLGLL